MVLAAASESCYPWIAFFRYIVSMTFFFWQTETAGIQRAQIQKELWRIQDVMEGLSKHKQQRSSAMEAGKIAYFPLGT